MNCKALGIVRGKMSWRGPRHFCRALSQCKYAFLGASWHRPGGMTRLASTIRRIQVGKQWYCFRICHSLPDKDVGRQYVRSPVKHLIPCPIRVHHGAVQIHATVQTLCASKRDEIRSDCRPRSSTDRPNCDAGIDADLERWREQGIEALVRHDHDHGLRHVHAGLKSDTCGDEIVERGTGPRAAVSRDE